ncbi:MAG: adenosylcobinamide-GDP ribazoletransferase [Actinomycetota bacterium]
MEALAFLTILPVRARPGAPGRAALVAFPLVGLLLGAAWAGIAWGAVRLWGPLPAAAFVLLFDLIATGGLHLDALADLADGLASRKPAGEARALMHRPEIGAVGAAVLVVALLLKFALIGHLVAQARLGDLVAVPVAGRLAMVVLISIARPAPGSALASGLSPAATSQVALWAGLTSLVVGLLVAGIPGVVAMMLAGLAAPPAGSYFRRRLGGITGDAVGAAGIGAEIVALGLLSGWR